jgi:hypothetical protein
MRCDGAGPDSASPQPVMARASSLWTAISQERPYMPSIERDIESKTQKTQKPGHMSKNQPKSRSTRQREQRAGRPAVATSGAVARRRVRGGCYGRDPPPSAGPRDCLPGGRRRRERFTLVGRSLLDRVSRGAHEPSPATPRQRAAGGRSGARSRRAVRYCNRVSRARAGQNPPSREVGSAHVIIPAGLLRIERSRRAPSIVRS